MGMDLVARAQSLGRDIATGVRFVPRLPSFLRRPITIEEARATLQRRLERRGIDFLRLARRAIYEHAASPYRELLSRAGCDYGDLERLVTQDGVEAALRTLYRHGVYLSVEEFKGRHPVVRGQWTIAVSPDRLRNPVAAPHVPARTSGSRSQATVVAFDLDFIRSCAIDTCLALEARGGHDWLKAVWGIPAVGGTFRILKYSSFGRPAARWFSPVDYESVLPLRWNVRALYWTSRLAGVPLPRPEHVPTDAPLPVARWMADALRGGQTPHMQAFASAAVRICQAAVDAGINLRGAQFTLAGEPITEARLATIRQSGAEAMPRYGSIETGPVGYGCLAPKAPDDVHFLDDRHAMIQPEAADEVHQPVPQALFISSLRPMVPFVLLNVSMGDQAVLERRSCRCPMEQLGWTAHLHGIRSYEKLTSAGMTFLDTDVIRVLEEVLPARFGGAPIDYQLLEEEGEDGRPVIRLLVHPAVGPLDPALVAEAFLTAVAPPSSERAIMGRIWRDAGVVRVDRRVPLTTGSGKVLHLHVKKP